MYNVENTTNKYYEKKTLVTINSIDRIKQHKLITNTNPNRVEKNGFKIIDYNTILVNHNHNYEITDTTEVIFKNIKGVYNANLNKNTIGGVPVEYLNYNEVTGRPIFNIEFIFNYEDNKKVSNSYKIHIPLNINNNLIILNTEGGGSNIRVEKINQFIRGYEDSSSYKIMLPRRFNNIKNVKLINLEMSNAQYAIRDAISKKYNINDDYISNNNFIHWINKENETNIGSNFLINNEKLLAVVNNNVNNVSTKWEKNETSEEILYEYLSAEYLNKINSNFDDLQRKFIDLLYLLKNKIEDPLKTTTITLTMVNTMIKHSDSYLLKFSNSGINYKLFLRDRIAEIDTTFDINYFINDFNTKENLINFVHNFTDYNSTINTYNSDLTINFDETYTYETTIPTTVQATGLNIYNYLRNITEYYITIDANDKLYFKFLNKDTQLEYYYIKYLFLQNIELLIKEVVQYNYNNLNKNKKLEIYKNEFMNYLIELNKNIKIPLSETQKNMIDHNYLISFTLLNTPNKIYRLYFYKKPVNTDVVINFSISDFNNITTFINFIKQLKLSNSTFTLIPTYTNNIYELPNTIYTLNNTTPNTTTNTANNNIPLYRNIQYIFDIDHNDLKDKIIKVTTSSTVTPVLDYNFNNNVITRDNKIYINISINENINNLYIINTTDSNKTIATISVESIDIYKTDISIYGYLHNLSLDNNIEYIYNNRVTNYTYINDSFVTLIKKINKEIINVDENAFNLLINNKPNLQNKYYWKLPTELNTNIYISETEQTVKMDSMVEDKNNYTDIFNIKYISRNDINIFRIYPIYSVQIPKGNYMMDEFILEMENKLNSMSKKIYDYTTKLFIEDTKYNVKTSLKKDINKPIFSVELNETNNLVYIYQYNKIYSYSSADLTEVNQSGPFIVNEGYPFIFIKHKNHSLKTGDLINITGASNIFNIGTSELNMKHAIFTHKIYRCHIRFILPLEDNANAVDISTDYLYEGNKFVNYSSYKSGINKIYNINNVTKDNIGTNTKRMKLDYDISIYELLIGKNDITTENANETKTVFGRVLHIMKDNNTNNYILDYSLLSDNNFKIGSIFKTGTTNTYAMIIPEDWTHNYLPKYHDLLNYKIEEVKNISEGYSIKIDRIPNKTSLVGVGGINITISVPIEYSLLFNKNDSLREVLGFENKMTDFGLVHSNTYNVEDCIIDHTYLENSFNDNELNKDKYVMLKTLIPHNYNIGSMIYMNNHTLNYDLINTYTPIRLNIKEYEPFISWYNNLPFSDQKNITTNLSSDIFKKYCDTGILIYYTYPYSNKQIQDLGNLGMSVRQYDNLNYFDYKETPIPNIYNLKPDTYIYVNQNQKQINKNVENVKIVYKIGLRDGYYKILGNIPIYNKSYYANFFNNTNCAIIECNYIKITENPNLKYINYNETIYSNTTKYKESVLEGYLNNGEIIAPSLDTQIIGNHNSNYNKYSTTFKEKNDNKLDVYFPVDNSCYFYINYVQNIYYINNSSTDKITIYEDVKYIFDISNINLLNKLFIISDSKINIIPYNSHNTNDIVNISGLPGVENSTIEINISPYSNINNLYFIIENITILELDIKEITVVEYSVELLNNDNYEFTNVINNNITINPIFKIELGTKYKFLFNTVISRYLDSTMTNEEKNNVKKNKTLSALTAYNNFMIVYDKIFNTKVNNDYIIYDNIELSITLFLINNNYDKELCYHTNNNNNILGKFVFGIYNYYYSDKLILLNSNYIDNINKKILNTEKINTNIDSNIINYIEYNSSNKYYFTIVCKNILNTIDDYSYIIPQHDIHFLYENAKKNTKKLKIKNNIETVYIKEVKNNMLILKTPNYNLVLNNLIKIEINVPNTLLKEDDIYYIGYIDSTFTKIRLANLIDKSLITISESVFTHNVTFTMNDSYYYICPNELINKSIKINYLASYDNLTNKTYNSEISKINNNIKHINTSNNIFYNNVSNNVYIIDDKISKNIYWKGPTGSIYIDLTQNTIINYIKFNNIDITNKNHPYRIYLYYIENNINNYIGSITDVFNNNIILNTFNKNKFILYIESNGLYNSVDSELYVSDVEIGYINPIKSDIFYINNYISKLCVNSIINKYTIPDIYIDDNTINDTSVLSLNNTKSAIIEIIFTTSMSLQYYKIIQDVNDYSIILGGKKYETIFKGTINIIQLYGSDNIDYSNEVEITDAKYTISLDSLINSTVSNTNDSDTYVINTKTYKNIEKTFLNENTFKYYRFKISSNLNYYPYLKPITDSNLNILSETLLLPSITDDYRYNFNTNIINVDNHRFNLNISGIIVGNYEENDYSNLYIEDLNYITHADIKRNYIELTLKYDLLNSHKIGENIIISNSETNENLFSTQNLIVNNKWYTRIFYQGYNSIYNNNLVSRTLYETTLEFVKGGSVEIYRNSKYLFKYTKNIKIYKVIIDKDKTSPNNITSINEINYDDYGIEKTHKSYDDVIYTEFIVVNPKYMNINVDIMSYKLILSPLNTVVSDALNHINYKDININFNNNKEGLPIVQDYLTNKLHIEKMNGFYIPEICYNTIDTTNTNNINNINKIDTKEIIKPVVDNNYNTFTYSNLDLVFKSDNRTLNVDNNNLYKNGIPIFGYFNNDIWTDINNSNNYYVNYYSVTLEGKYLGFNGNINNKIINTDSLMNKNINGFKVLDIGYDNNNIKNIVKLDLKISDLGIENPSIYLGDLNLIKNETKKNDYVIGYGGNVFQKKIYKNITGINGPKHLYLSINGLNNTLTTNKTNYFSKIILSSNPGSHLYDTFVENETYFEKEPLNELSELEIKFINDDGKLFDLEHSEHSFMLEITELINDYDNSKYLIN